MKQDYILIIDDNGLDYFGPETKSNPTALALRMRFNPHRNPSGYVITLDETAARKVQDNWPTTRSAAEAIFLENSTIKTQPLPSAESLDF